MISSTEMQGYEKKLRALLSRASDDIRHLEVELGQIDVRESSPKMAVASSLAIDPGAAGVEDALDFVLLEHEQNTHDECSAALGRIEAGTFGVCEQCQRPIQKSRLRALPYARLCLDCALHEGKFG